MPEKLTRIGIDINDETLQAVKDIAEKKATKENVSFIIEGFYEAIKELLTALLLKNGLRSKNHRCLISFFYKNYPKYEKEAYLIEYTQFISKYKQGQTSGEEVGEVISRMAQYFAEKNLLLVGCSEGLTRVAADIVQGDDEATGKPISVSKADILIKATPESAAVRSIKADIENNNGK